MTKTIQDARNLGVQAFCQVDSNGVPIDTVTIGTVVISQTTPGTTNAVAIDQSTPGTTNAVTDAGVAWTQSWGVTAVPFTSADQHSAAASVTDAPTSGKKLVIDDLIFSVDTTMNVTFKCETTGTVIAGPFYILANTSMHIRPRGKGWKLATADKKLQVLASVSGNIMVLAGYHSET